MTSKADAPSLKRRVAVFLVLVLLLLVGYWFLRPVPNPGQTPLIESAETEPIEQGDTAQMPTKPVSSSTNLPAVGNVILAPIAEEVQTRLHSAETTPIEDLFLIQDLLKLYRKANGGRNPSGGENEEIVAILAGKNAKTLAVVSPEHPAIDDQGRLLDRWGTPYWFHPVRSDFMEIRSAGPDRELFTEDDVHEEGAATSP